MSTELEEYLKMSDHEEKEVESDDDSIFSADTFGSISEYGRMETVMAKTLGSDDLELLLSSDKIRETLSGNPQNWTWVQIQLWLHRKNLAPFIEVFDIQHKHNFKPGIDPEELLDITLDKLFDESGPYNTGKKLDIKPEEREDHPLIERFFRELTKLELRTNDIMETHTETTIDDLIEMKRRIQLFVDKWDKILWINQFVETNNRIPTLDEMTETLEISESVASVYIEYYHSIERIKAKDLAEVLLDFNVYDDSVIWWYLIISSLKTYPSKSMWLIFEKVAEITPGSVAIELLEQYRFDLTRFNALRLNKVCQNIVIGSAYPICVSLRIAKWFNDRAEYDVARSQLFADIAQSYIDAANDYISFVESDHLATILLEVKSDIDGMSALDMALEFKLQTFVSTNRVERVTTSIMHNFAFLKPKNRSDAFEIEPLSLDLIWKKIFEKDFYLTPLGLYVTTIVLYLCYLTLFTYLSIKQTQVYEPIHFEEVLFWVLNFGYILNEIQQIVSSGIRQYISETENRFDVIISGVFISAFILRFIALYRGTPNCGDISSNCWKNGKLNTAFVMLWGIATIILWMRLITFCVLSHKLGPMVQMIFKMADDIITFFEIMLILFFGFTFALMFIMHDVHSDFDTPLDAALTLITAIIAEFDFGAFSEEEDTNKSLLYFGYGVMMLYLIIGSLVLLNLLIAMMATTYEHIDENATQAIIFSRFQLALSLDRDASFMPPPLNVLAIVLLLIFYGIEKVVNFFAVCVLCGHSYDLAAFIMPGFLKKRKLELDEQILWDKCRKSWIIMTHRGPTVAKAVKYNHHLHKHYIKFYETNGYDSDDTKWNGVRVSVQGDVAKKHCWLLDLLDLSEHGLMDLKQFDNVRVDRLWTNEAHDSMKDAKAKHIISPYWICGFCRGYIKQSRASISRLGRLMKVNDLELKLIKKVSPTVCPNCYRVRFERKRWEFIWEIMSIWIFYIIVFPILFIIFGMFLLLRLIRDPAEMARSWELLKTKLYSAEPEVVEFVNEAREIQDEKRKYVSAHYSDAQLIATLNASSREHKLFDSNIRNIIWKKLYTAKDAIDAALLKAKINNYIMAISKEDDLTPFEFFVDYINMESLRQNNRYDTLWMTYFAPLSMTIFKRIENLRSDYLPLHLFARYPFDIKEIVDDLEQFMNKTSDGLERKSLSSLTKDDVMSGLIELKFLNCTNDEERQYILDSIERNTTEYKDHKNIHNAFFPKFMKYLTDITSLFQSSRNIKNMLRDCNVAIIERGADASLFADQLYFLFDDIKNSIMAYPFFNSLRTERVMNSKREQKVELWTIRNTLKSLYFLNNATRMHILRKHKKQYVSIDEILDFVFKLYNKDIIDPDGITKRIHSQSQADQDDYKDREFEEKGRELPAQRSLFPNKRRVSLIVGEGDENDYTESYEERTAQRHLVIQQRMELFRKEQITALEIQTEITEIFHKLQQRRTSKITETTIDYYRRNGLKNVRLLQDDECLRFIYEQLARFVTFNPDKAETECDLNLLKQILCNTLSFDANGKYKIDDETIPKRVRNNDMYIEQLYDHLSDIFRSTEFKDKDCVMRVQDIASIVMLYERIFSVVEQKIIDSADEFVVNHDLFCKFVDGKDFDVDKDADEWSNKTRVASNLYQSVLDIQQNFVTLGQIRQTMDILLSDICAMKCGELIRLINHIHNKMKSDIKRCIEQRKVYTKEVANLNKQLYGSSYSQLQAVMATNDGGASTLYDDADEEGTQSVQNIKSIRLQSVSTAKKAKRKNPSLQFKHVHAMTWNGFIKHIAHKFHHDIKSAEIFDELQNESNKYHDKTEIMHVILENTQFDIICDDNKGVIHELKEEKYAYDELEDNKENEAKERIKKSRVDLFENILSFNSRRITLQQLFGFARQFRAFLKRNKNINDLMMRYRNVLLKSSNDCDGEDDEDVMMRGMDELNLKREQIAPHRFCEFRDKYFDAYAVKGNDEFIAEMKWLYLNTENEYVLCERVYPFWGNKLINNIYTFMESTEHIQGIYELKAAEFGQLKYSLNVNYDHANKLFNIIRFKYRSLSWQQLYNFFVFVLSMKYNVQNAILQSKQAEDTTVSNDGMKILLKIGLDDESKWLFDKVLFFNGSKVTWKQIREYLTKVIRVRDDMRDFFKDQQRDRHYQENKAEIIEEISKNVEKVKNENKEINMEDIVHILNTIKMQNQELKKEIDLLKKQMK